MAVLRVYDGAGFVAVGGGTGGLAGTGGYYIVGSAQPLLPGSRILTSGSSTTVRTDATAIYVDAITGGSGVVAKGFSLDPQAAKLYSSTSAARIDAGTAIWRLLYSALTQQFGIWQFHAPADFGTNPHLKILWGMDSGIAVARSCSWIVDQWGWNPSIANSSMYIDTYGGTNTVSIALSAAYSAGNIQALTVPLATIVSLQAGNLIRIRVSGSGSPGNMELVGNLFSYTEA